MNIDSVNWGNLGYRERYEDLLAYKVRVGVGTAIFFILGVLFLIQWAFKSEAPTAFVFAFSVFVLVLILLSLIISDTNRQIRGIEIFLGFYERRHEVRHAVYCKNHFYCMVLHYFQITTRRHNTENHL